MTDLVTMGVNAICRPMRATYANSAISNTCGIFGYGEVIRYPFNIPNSRGYHIKGSLYQTNNPIPTPSAVIYLHGNASNQIEGQFLVPIFCPIGISVVCFDFCGCGNSEGEYISLGYFEKDDVDCVMSHLRAQYQITKFSLYGRSMGGATTFFCAKNPMIVSIVADSPFACLSDLIKEISDQQNIPGFIASSAARYLAGKVKDVAGFDIYKVNPIEYAKESVVPIMLIHGSNDDFINPNHSRKLLEKYKGTDKTLLLVDGDHSSPRPPDAIATACSKIAFMFNTQINPNVITDELLQNEMHFTNFDEMMNDG